ncbi:MAG TPA: GFA family protein [Thermoanaerobaculia bacterium]|jgi:hypothetical protein
MSVASHAQGSCACGAIKYAVILPVKWCAHCHCHACRRNHGAPIVTWFGVANENFRLSGREHLKWYLCSDEAKRGFCMDCGTPLLFMSTRWPDEVHVTRASLLSEVSIMPGAHLYTDQRADWFPFEDSLPHCEKT